MDTGYNKTTMVIFFNKLVLILQFFIMEINIA